MLWSPESQPSLPSGSRPRSPPRLPQPPRAALVSFMPLPTVCCGVVLMMEVPRVAGRRVRRSAFVLSSSAVWALLTARSCPGPLASPMDQAFGTPHRAHPCIQRD